MDRIELTLITPLNSTSGLLTVRRVKEGKPYGYSIRAGLNDGQLIGRGRTLNPEEISELMSRGALIIDNPGFKFPWRCPWLLRGLLCMGGGGSLGCFVAGDLKMILPSLAAFLTLFVIIPWLER